MKVSTSDRLVEVAGVYTAAVLDGRPPTLAVAERFGVSKSRAANLVAAARHDGKLPVTTRGRTAIPQRV